MRIRSRQQKQQALDLNKKAIVAARISGDEDLQKLLSQERQKIKKQTFCVVCDAPLSPPKDSPTTHCRMHNPQLLSMKMKRWIATAVVLFSIPLLAAPSPNTASVFAYFSFPSTPVDFSNYTLYWGTSSSNYTASVIGVSTNLTVNGLVRGQTYYFNVTQSTTNGLESDYTTEAIVTIRSKPPRAISLSGQAQ